MNKPRRSWASRALLVATASAAALLSACTSLGVPSKVTLSQAQLQALMEHSFPIERQMMDLFEVRASSPSLRLLPQANRMAATVDLNLREKILATRMKGRLEFDSALRWEPSDNTVRLDQVRVQDLSIDGVPGAAPRAVAPGSTQTGAQTGAQRTGLERMAAAMSERVLENMVLYRLTPEKLADMDRVGVRPGSLNITGSGLEINLVPKAK